MTATDAEAARCPACGGRRLKTVQVELTEQSCRDGEWGQSRLVGGDAYWICRVACEGCGTVLFDIENAVMAALARLVDAPDAHRR